MAIEKFQILVPGGQPLTIYAEPDNINYFINGDLEPDVAGDVTNVQYSVPAHSRRQYPGDTTPVAVSAAAREVLVDPKRRISNALPGKPFVVAKLDPDGTVSTEAVGNRQVPVKRQFTFSGRWLDLHAFFSAEASYPLKLYGPNKARTKIAAAIAP